MTVRLKTYKRKPSPSLQSSQLKDQSMVITNYLANELQELENVLVIQEQADGEKTQTLIALNTAVDANSASITSEATTRSSADTALASLVTTLAATVTNGDSTNAASITSEATARADADSAEATARELVAASVVTETEARVAADGTLATDITTVASSVTTEATARAAADNTLLAKYGVTLNSNGYVTGFAQNNDGTTGTFKILADKFTIIDPSDSAGEAGTQVFDIENGVVTMGSAHIGNLSIGTGKITDNAVTNASFLQSNLYAYYAINDSTFYDLTVLTISLTGAKVRINSMLRFHAANTNNTFATSGVVKIDHNVLFKTYNSSGSLIHTTNDGTNNVYAMHMNTNVSMQNTLFQPVAGAASMTITAQVKVRTHGGRNAFIADSAIDTLEVKK